MSWTDYSTDKATTRTFVQNDRLLLFFIKELKLSSVDNIKKIRLQLQQSYNILRNEEEREFYCSFICSFTFLLILQCADLFRLSLKDNFFPLYKKLQRKEATRIWEAINIAKTYRKGQKNTFSGLGDIFTWC